VEYSCEHGDFSKYHTGPIMCLSGQIQPSKVGCYHPSKEPYHTSDDRHMNKKTTCGPPPKERGAVSFTEGRPIDYSKDRRLLVLIVLLIHET